MELRSLFTSLWKEAFEIVKFALGIFQVIFSIKNKNLFIEMQDFVFYIQRQQKYFWWTGFFSHAEAYLNNFRKVHLEYYRIAFAKKNIRYIGYIGAKYDVVITFIGNSSNKNSILVKYFFFHFKYWRWNDKIFFIIIGAILSINTPMLFNILCQY